jgi:Arc/MetJ family transcription regulator
VATNLAIDDDLIRQAQEVGHHKTKKEAVTEALREYVQRRQQLEILDLFGTIDYADDYDYKALRRRR